MFEIVVWYNPDDGLLTSALGIIADAVSKAVISALVLLYNVLDDNQAKLSLFTTQV